MEYIFLDNFRGFKNHSIPIMDVNFLVGENSTGKSSVLFALKLISNQSFWINVNFNNDESQTYSFEDLVSAESNDKSYFRIGCIYDDNTTNPSFIFKFINRNGKPVISDAIISYNKNASYFCVAENGIKYKIIESDNSIIEKMNNISKKDLRDMNLFKDAPISLAQQPLVLLSIINSSMKNDKTTRPLGLPIMPISFVAPIRSKPKKTYDEPGSLGNSEGEHIPYEIRRILTKKSKSAFEKNIIAFGQESGLFKTISIREYESSDDAPFRMNVILEKEPINIVNVGYGVSQVLPVIFEVFTGNRNKIIAIQQPEVHLHPKAQAALGELFFDFASGENKKRMTIETHSDYLIDRFRQMQKKSDKKVKSQVLFFERNEGFNISSSIVIDGLGNYDNDQPPAFRAFFIKEELENLGL